MDGTMTFQDIFKKKFVEGMELSRMNLSAPVIIFTLGLAMILGLFIFYVYKKTFKGVLYSLSFNISLIMLTMVTAMVIMAISSNVALSLGMVGALSIVRFRTAVKEPLDTVYMFWAIAAGITLGAGFYLFSAIGCLVIGIVLFVMSLLPGMGAQHFLLVLHFDPAAQTDVQHMLARLPRPKLKSKTTARGGIEATYELRLSPERASVTEEFLRLPGVHDATLVSYQSEML